MENVIIPLCQFPASILRHQTDNNPSQDVESAPLPNSKGPPRNIWGLTPEDPTKFPTQITNILDRKETLRDGDLVRLAEYLDNACFYIFLTPYILKFGVGSW